MRGVEEGGAGGGDAPGRRGRKKRGPALGWERVGMYYLFIFLGGVVFWGSGLWLMYICWDIIGQAGSLGIFYMGANSAMHRRVLRALDDTIPS